MRFLRCVFYVFFFSPWTRVWHYSFSMNNDFRLMNSAKCVNNKFFIIILLFSVFSKISGTQTDPKYIFVITFLYKLFIHFVIVNLWSINIFRLFLLLIFPSSKLKSLLYHYLKLIILLAGFTFLTSFEEERERDIYLLIMEIVKKTLSWIEFDFL